MKFIFIGLFCLVALCLIVAGILFLLAYFKEKEASILADKIEKAYGAPGDETMFWDDVVNAHLDALDMYVEPVVEGQLVEIDTVEELEKINSES